MIESKDFIDNKLQSFTNDELKYIFENNAPLTQTQYERLKRYAMSVNWGHYKYDKVYFYRLYGKDYYFIKKNFSKQEKRDSNIEIILNNKPKLVRFNTIEYKEIEEDSSEYQYY